MADPLWWCCRCDRDITSEEVDFDNMLIQTEFDSMPMLGQPWEPKVRNRKVYFKHKKCNMIVFEVKENK